MNNRHFYKGYDRKYRCWRFGGFVAMRDFYYYGKSEENCRIIEPDAVEDNDIGFSYEVDPDSVCQFTGKRDVHDNGVYEHDLIRYYNYDKTSDSEDNILQVVWDSDLLGYYVDGNGCHFSLSELEFWEFEVVGNRYNMINGGENDE